MPKYTTADFVGACGALNDKSSVAALAQVVAQICKSAGVLDEATAYMVSQIPDKDLASEQRRLEALASLEERRATLRARPDFSALEGRGRPHGVAQGGELEVKSPTA